MAIDKRLHSGHGAACRSLSSPCAGYGIKRAEHTHLQQDIVVLL